MKLIWYNPGLNSYQKGTVEEYRHIFNPKLEVVYEFTNTSDRIIDKVVDSLNHTIHNK